VTVGSYDKQGNWVGPKLTALTCVPNKGCERTPTEIDKVQNRPMWLFTQNNLHFSGSCVVGSVHCWYENNAILLDAELLTVWERWMWW
jgi:hypothetical protein